jgi:quinol monooxygenase YgiN
VAFSAGARLMARHGLFGSLTTHPGKRDELVAILLEAARLQGAMEGCELYVVHTSESDPNKVFVSEVWRTKADHEKSMQSEQVLGLIKRGRPLIATMGPERFDTTPVGGKGLN